MRRCLAGNSYEDDYDDDDDSEARRGAGQTEDLMTGQQALGTRWPEIAAPPPG